MEPIPKYINVGKENTRNRCLYIIYMRRETMVIGFEINRKESLYIAINNYKSYVQIKISTVMYNVVPEKCTL